MEAWHPLWIGIAAAVILFAVLAVHRGYTSDMARARGRIAAGSTDFQSSFGRTEYAVRGDGPPVIVIHGTGGGFDQGLTIACPLIERRWRVIAPSRFGYLRSDIPSDPSSENQADAVAELMDELGIARAPVLGASAGALAAMQFALRHPQRCSALVAMVPAAFAPGRPPPQPGVLGRAVMTWGLRSDFLFWIGIRLAPDMMIRTLLATDADLVHRAAPAEQARVQALLNDILPVSARARGLVNDALLAGSPEPMPLERITAPTLAISLADDRFQTLAAARHIAATVPGAKLVSFADGGHVGVGRNGEIFDTVEAFLTLTQARPQARRNRSDL